MNKTLLSVISTLLFFCTSAIVQAALPISSVQTTDFDSAVGSGAFGDIEPSDNPIDDLTYEAWRLYTLAGNPGITSLNSPADQDIATTTISIGTDDNSEFMAISIDYSVYGPTGSSYDLALYGYLAGAQVPGAFFSELNIVTGDSGTLNLNWDNIDEIRVTVDSDYVVFDNVTVGPATTTYPIGFTVSGLVPSSPPGDPAYSVTLLNNGGDAISPISDGFFGFATELANGADYDITIGFQPDNQTCTVNDGTGTVASAPVTTPTVTCDPPVTPTPTPPPAATPVPTISAYGLVLTVMALLILAGRRLRVSAKCK